jgi:hypothetical protein
MGRNVWLEVAPAGAAAIPKPMGAMMIAKANRPPANRRARVDLIVISLSIERHHRDRKGQ